MFNDKKREEEKLQKRVEDFRREYLELARKHHLDFNAVLIYDPIALKAGLIIKEFVEPINPLSPKEG